MILELQPAEPKPREWDTFVIDEMSDGGWTKRYCREVRCPSKARIWYQRELDRRSNVRRSKRARELDRRRNRKEEPRS